MLAAEVPLIAHRHVGPLLAALLAVCPPMLAAQSTPAPAGLRVFTTGHSFHAFVPPLLEELVRKAAIKGHQQVGIQRLGGSTALQHWELADSLNTAKPALISGGVDVFTMSPVVAVPDPGIARFAALGLEHNPKLRLLVQASWIPGEQALPVLQPERNRWLKDNAIRDQTRVADLWPAINDFRSRIERQVDALNRTHGRRVLFIIPVGDAILELRELVEAGAFPGITKQSQLFNDPVGHGKGPVNALTAYCNFAAIYRMSPVGLNLDLPDVTAEQHRILQELAWRTVSRYAYSGVSGSRGGKR
jgi:hypothetical protein